MTNSKIKSMRRRQSAKQTASRDEGGPDPQDVANMVALYAQERYSETAALAHAMTLRFPMHGMSWKLLGVALRRMGRSANALTAMERTSVLLPGDAEAHNNLGTVFQDLRRFGQAEISYRRALQINPSLVQTHFNLGNILRALGRPGDAEISFRQVLGLKPDYVEAYSCLGTTLHDLCRFNEAEASYRRALQIKPDYAEAHNNLGNALRALNRLSEAEASFRRTLEIASNIPQPHFNLGNVLRDLGRPKEAETSYRKALEIKPDYADAQTNLGCALMELGRIDEAEEFLNQGLALAPGEAAPLAAALFYFPYQSQDPRFNQLEVAYARRGSFALEDRIKLNFAMGKAMENVGQYDRAFSAYEEGNRLYYEGHSFDEAADQSYLDQSRSLFTADLFEKYAALSTDVRLFGDQRQPIFVVGMPRSGTTLIEQILASHPAVFGAGELTTLSEIAKKAWLLLCNSTNAEATLFEMRELGRQYLDRVWALAPDAQAIIDKQPGNYAHLGLIHLLLPKAKIIHCVREPMDTCLSCYALLFRTGHHFSYDLGMLGRHYLRYRKRVEHWANVLPADRILDVRYEANVADPEREARRMLDHLELSWDAACLKFYETKRAVSTASVAQVRKPMYSHSVARWKRFEKHLSPLLEIITQQLRQ